MKVHITSDQELKERIQKGLKRNQGFCPCVANSLNEPEYKCMCKDFLENVLVGQSCHCGLYIKDEQ